MKDNGSTKYEQIGCFVADFGQIRAFWGQKVNEDGGLVGTGWFRCMNNGGKTWLPIGNGKTKRKITDEEIIAAVKAGLADDEIAEKYNMCISPLCARRVKLNLEANPRRENIDFPDIPKTTLAYMAGILDGEGSVMIKKYHTKHTTNPGYTERICVRNSNKEVIELFKTFFKGCFTLENKVHQSKSGFNRHKLMYSFDAMDKNAYIVAKMLYPHLIIKKKQAGCLIALRKEKRKGRGRFRGGPSGRVLPAEAIERRERLYAEVKNANNSKI